MLLLCYLPSVQEAAAISNKTAVVIKGKQIITWLQ